MAAGEALPDDFDYEDYADDDEEAYGDDEEEDANYVSPLDDMDPFAIFKATVPGVWRGRVPRHATAAMAVLMTSGVCDGGCLRASPALGATPAGAAAYNGLDADQRARCTVRAMAMAKRVCNVSHVGLSHQLQCGRIPHVWHWQHALTAKSHRCGVNIARTHHRRTRLVPGCHPLLQARLPRGLVSARAPARVQEQDRDRGFVKDSW